MDHHVFRAHGFQFQQGVLGFMARAHVLPRADSIRQVPGHAVPQAGVESAAHLRNVEPGVDAETHSAGSEDAAFGRMLVHPAGQVVFDGILAGSRRPPAPSLSGIRPKLRRAGQQHRGRGSHGAETHRLVRLPHGEADGFDDPQRQEQLELDGVAARFWNGIEAVHVEDRGDEAESKGCQRHEAQIERAAQPAE